MYAIDYGTTNSLLSWVNSQGQSKVLNLDPAGIDPTVMRSLIYFADDSKEPYFGQAAIDEYVASGAEGRFLRSIKKFLPQQNFKATQIGGKMYPLDELIACFLREMKSRAGLSLHQEINKVILGRPAKYSLDESADQLAMDRMEKAAKLAGFKEIHFFPEPLAAAYDLRREIDSEKIVLVADLGGGTSDFTVIKISPKPFQPEDVLLLGGVSVAGDAFDSAIMERMISPFFGSEVQYKMPMGLNTLSMPSALKYKINTPAEITLLQRSDLMHHLKNVQNTALGEKNKSAMDRLFALVEDNLGFSIFEKIEASKLSACKAQKAHFEFSYPDIEVEKSFNYDEFCQAAHQRFHNILDTLDETVKKSGISPEKIDFVCYTGGTSHIPEIGYQLQSRFGQEKFKTLKQFHSVIHGLSERAKDLI